MSDTKPIPIIVETNSKTCPVCGKRSYSRAGVHPQCSMVLADAPRKLKLAAEKKALADVKQRGLTNVPTEPLLDPLADEGLDGDAEDSFPES